MTCQQQAKADDARGREQKQVQDSTRYAAVLREKKKAETQRDSVMRQLNIIKTIDNNRFVWPHIMDEVSRALPQYTWLVSIKQTSAAAQPRRHRRRQGRQGQEQEGEPDPDEAPQAMKFEIVGNTVDIQALTRFMKLLEASPFIQNVQLDELRAGRRPTARKSPSSRSTRSTSSRIPRRSARFRSRCR